MLVPRATGPGCVLTPIEFRGKPGSEKRGSADTFMRNLGAQVSLFLDF